MSIASHDIQHGYRVGPQSPRATNKPSHECLLPQLDQHLRSGMKPHWVDAVESHGDAKVKAKAGAERPGLERHEAPKHRASGHPSTEAPPSVPPPAQAAHQARQDHRADAPRTHRPTTAHTSSVHAPSATAATRAPQAAAATVPNVVSKVAQATAATISPATPPDPSASTTTKPTPSGSTTTSIQEPASRAVTSGINTEVLDKAEEYSKEAAGLGERSAEDLMQSIRDLAEKDLRSQSEMGVMQLATKMNEAVAKTIKTAGESIKGLAG